MIEDEFIQLQNEVFDCSLQSKLWPFLSSYRPHDEIETWKDLRDRGLERVKSEDTLDNLSKVVGESVGQQWRSWMTLEEVKLE